MNLLLAYIINNPKETINPNVLSEQDRIVYTTLRKRFAENKPINFDRLAEGTFYSPINIEIAATTNLLTKAEFQEYKEEAEDKYRLAQFDKLFSRYFALFSEAEPKNKLGVLIELKEQLLHSDTSQKKYEVHHANTMFHSWLEAYDKPVEYVAKTGFPALDRVLGGFRGSELAVIVADTNVGKTNLLINMAVSMTKAGKSILFFSLEMGVNELIDRLVPIYGNFSVQEITERAVQKDFLGKTVTELSALNLTIISSGSITSEDVLSEAINYNPDIIMVDYLQLLADPKGKENETERLRQMVLKLKRGALNLNKPIITPAQVDKASSKSGSIKIENIASSKEIANSADIGLYLYEKEINGKDQSVLNAIKYETRLRLVKSRHSQKGFDIKINFDHRTMQMTEDNKESQTAIETKNLIDLIKF